MIDTKSFKGAAIIRIIMALLPFGIVLLLILYFGGPVKKFIQGFLNGLSNTGKSISEKLGLSKSDAEKNVDANIANKGNCFDPLYYTKVPRTHFISYKQAEEYATRIHDAIVGKYGFSVYKDGNEVLHVIQSCQYQNIVSWVADVFGRVYKADMLGYIQSPGYFRSGLNDEDLEKIINYAKSLPAY